MLTKITRRKKINSLTTEADMSVIASQKKELRKKILSLRRALSLEERNMGSEQIFTRLCKEISFQKANNVFAYAAMTDEVQTLAILKMMLEADKKVFLPHIMGKRSMQPIRLKKITDLHAGKYGILTVDAEEGEFIEPEKLDCILVPGVAFDKMGNRLGMGGGYYDTLLPKAVKAVRLALAYDMQIVDKIPCELHDCRMNLIITEKASYFCNG